MDERARRLALNEALFRDVNERIRETGRHYPALGGDSQDYICECSNTDCTLHLTLTEAEYEAVRADPMHFVVAPEHHMPEIEDVVEIHDAYWVVSKRGDTGEFVALLDPRSSVNASSG